MSTLRYAVGVILLGRAVVHYAVSLPLPAAHPMNGPPIDTAKSIAYINGQRLGPILIGLGAQHATLKISKCNDMLECLVMVINMRRSNKVLGYSESGVDSMGHHLADQIPAQIPNCVMFRRMLPPYCEIMAR